jgi:nucleotide-binding universal stress UspA family protein
MRFRTIPGEAVRDRILGRGRGDTLMPNSAVRKEDLPDPRHIPAFKSNNHPLRVVACVDTSPVSARVIPHASAIAEALGGELSLIHVIEPDSSQLPSDPVEWDIRKREADLFVAGLARQYQSATNIISTKVLEGHSAEKIGECTAGRIGDITALCRNDDLAQGRIGETVRRVMEASCGSLLLVPATASEDKQVHYRRILVPLDGSSRAETAIPIAVRLAAEQGAELVLVNATPKLDLIHGGPPDIQDIELQGRLSRRNVRAAREYLAQIKESLSGCDVTVNTVVLEEGDVRRRLADAVTIQSADLLVLSSHGHSGYADVPAGDVSTFMLAHVGIPVLMVRRPRPVGTQHVHSSAQSMGVRRPRGSFE